jgi:serine/threonine protein kinase
MAGPAFLVGFCSVSIEFRFRREHQAPAKLNHPNIVHFLDAGLTDDDQAYVVMEYIEDAQPIVQLGRNRPPAVGSGKVSFFRQQSGRRPRQLSHELRSYRHPLFK